MKRTVYIAINGIRTNPGDAEGWTDRFVTWVNTVLPDGVYGEKFEYYTSALLRGFRQRLRAKQIAKMVGYYTRAGYRVVLVGHSNGCDLIARVLHLAKPESDELPADLKKDLKIDCAHLISPAADEESFADAVRNKLVRCIHIYGSKNDGALRFAQVTRPLIGWLGLGYGSMGLRGREFAAMFPDVVQDHSDDSHGHSTWMQRGPNFEEMMLAISAHDFADQKTLTL